MWIKHSLARSDVYCGTWSPDRAAYPLADERGLGYAWKFVDRSIPEDPPGVWRVPWASVIPFGIDRGGRVRLGTAVVLERADNSDIVRPIGLGRLEAPLVCAFYDHGADSRVRPLGAWSWPDGGAVEFSRPRNWTAVHTGVELRPGSSRGSMRTPLPPTPAVTTLFFRVTAPEVARDNAGTSRVLFDVEGPNGATTLCAEDLSGPGAAREQRWRPVTLTVRPHAGEALTLAVRVEGDEGSPPVIVTSGLWSAHLP
jgi:hypothetical protein